ncbi:helix-turn-helix domain-containing protein [Photobacterium sp. WH77]|uniref:Helix-turn-helix domain-containing protein n=1 Tax=Photobacterium arenosum TaxID=2774143 RepID=A0ABR9BRR1_9GAMM|nr:MULTISPECIES: helix-turn-helix domain-containing protein [Photobacterium]MBD8514191.1 helix-turn-helix domain-containing protein [Photobacterium arenosum]MBV7262891.1 helix-turn-helix domain-containing protein [Photobacterium sp. WH24]MCG2837747.1 helix-turn-helix domain-containing protein [Photobacterium sp. WH77]MCG2845363.1 helix-turn-helix domain-containing protein [Photobacterium sp. WH80]MDO6581393.1 helix-turn-helix domain-containing protein [Photobacterium sp. 2_MG-2023]
MKIAFVLYPRALITGISLAAEMLSSAASLRPKQDQRSKPVSISVVAESLSPPAVKSGLRLQPDLTLKESGQFDFVILPPIWGNPISALKQCPELVSWLTHQYQQGAKIIATGTGVCWLAETGLLDQQVATTHWYYYDKFAARYPAVVLNRQASITVANGLYCTVSINSQSELILYLIREHFGQSVAKTVETHFGHEISQSDQQPFYQIGGEVQFDESIALAQDWLKRNLSRPITAKDVAEQCGLPLRTFQRRFKTQVGQTPHEYLQSLRMEAAQILLRDFGLSVQDVAEQVGYRDAHHFSTRFQQQFTLSPSQYRHMVKAKIYQA